MAFSTDAPLGILNARSLEPFEGSALMASPSRHQGEDQWTETDQEIIESLLMVDGSSRPAPPVLVPTVTTVTSTPMHPSGAQIVPPLPHRNPLYAIPAPGMRPQVVVPVAYWVATQPPTVPPHHPYHTIQPTFVHPSLPLRSAAEMELQDLMSEEERKAKHREVQRRFVQRKKEQMERVRREAAQLEKRHACLKLSLEQLSLEKENSELQEQIEDEDEICVPTMDEICMFLEEECVAAEKGYEPLTEDEFSDVLRETMEVVGESVMRDTRKFDDATKVQVMGWTGRHSLDSDVDNKAGLRFEITKEFLRAKPEDVVDRAWAQVSSPDGYRRLFSQSIPIKVAKLQEINDDAVVVFKTLFNPLTAAVHHSVDLLCRIKANDETLIISRGIDCPSVQQSVRDDSGWISSVSVLGFAPPKPPAPAMPGQPVPPPPLHQTEARASCVFRYKGSKGGATESNLRYWLLEVLFIMIRFETSVVAPLFVLAPP